MTDSQVPPTVDPRSVISAPFVPALVADPMILVQKLFEAHPDAHCELDHTTPFQLLVATVLSAQSTDVMVNKVTPGLFARFADAKSLAGADVAEVEVLIGRLGMFRQKSARIVELSKQLVANHQGEVPRTLLELTRLPGVGRKTANVVLGVCFGTPEGVVVDTHVQRLSQRLGFTHAADPETIEQDLVAKIPREHWDRLSHTLIFQGRRVCDAQRPKCDDCSVQTLCPSSGQAASVGRKTRS